MKRTVFMLTILAATITVGAEAVGPTFSVENNRIVLGEIKSGNDAVATFVFHNQGPEDVTIIRAKPS